MKRLSSIIFICHFIGRIHLLNSSFQLSPSNGTTVSLERDECTIRGRQVSHCKETPYISAVFFFYTEYLQLPQNKTKISICSLVLE